jgi:hypothetical protein
MKQPTTDTLPLDLDGNADRASWANGSIFNGTSKNRQINRSEEDLKLFHTLQQRATQRSNRYYLNDFESQE